jgi:acyl-CoA thioester hydrolase
MPEPYRTSISPRWSDQDLNGHVNHAAVVTLLEESRIKWRAEMPENHQAGATPTVVAALELNYRRPVHHGEDLDIELAVSRIGTSSFTLEFSGAQSGALAVEGRTVLVSTWPETGKARPLAEHERHWLARFQHPPAHSEAREPQIPHRIPLELTK